MCQRSSFDEGFVAVDLDRDRHDSSTTHYEDSTRRRVACWRTPIHLGSCDWHASKWVVCERTPRRVCLCLYKGRVRVWPPCGRGCMDRCMEAPGQA